MKLIIATLSAILLCAAILFAPSGFISGTFDYSKMYWEVKVIMSIFFLGCAAGVVGLADGYLDRKN